MAGEGRGNDFLKTFEIIRLITTDNFILLKPRLRIYAN